MQPNHADNARAVMQIICLTAVEAQQENALSSWQCEKILLRTIADTVRKPKLLKDKLQLCQQVCMGLPRMQGALQTC
jgi:hypothetical protein